MSLIRILILGFLCILPSCGSAATQPADQEPAIVPPTEAESQDVAWLLAKQVDLPQIARADRLELTLGLDSEKNRRVIKITDAATLDAFRNSLKITDDPPSAGEADAQLNFYRGPALVRTIWVYPYGEWGVKRPGTSYTCGVSQRLRDAITVAAK